jgi:hypothetical protein
MVNGAIDDEWVKAALVLADRACPPVHYSLSR